MKNERRSFLATTGMAGLAFAGSMVATTHAGPQESGTHADDVHLAGENLGTYRFRGTGGDDASAINAALQQAAGGTLLVMGVSRISQPIIIPSNTRLLAIGAIWKWLEDWSVSNPTTMIELDDKSNLIIDGLEIDGEHEALDHHNKAVSAIALSRATHVVIRNSYIHDLRGPDTPARFATGVSMSGDNVNITIENNTIANVQRNCIDTWASTGMRRNVAVKIIGNRLIKPRVRNCVLISSSETGTPQEDGGFIPPSAGIGDVTIIGNELAETQSLYAIRLSGSLKSIIANNHFRDNVGCINRNPLWGHETIITGNIMRNTTGDVVELNDSGRSENHTIFSNNVIDGAGGYLVSYRPSMTGEGEQRRSVLSIMGNVSTGGKGYRFVTNQNQGPDACQIQISGNSITAPTEAGIAVVGINRPMITGNRVTANEPSTGCGVYVTESEKPTIIGNMFTGSYKKSPIEEAGNTGAVVEHNQT